jgi:hypothetical protein
VLRGALTRFVGRIDAVVGAANDRPRAIAIGREKAEVNRPAPREVIALDDTTPAMPTAQSPKYLVTLASPAVR